MVREVSITFDRYSVEVLTELRFEDAWLCSLLPDINMDTFSRVLEVIWQ